MPEISTTASGENMFVTSQFEFALGTYTWRCTHANRFVCEIEKNAVCFKQDCFSLKFFFDVVYVNGGGVKVDEHCNYRLLVWERYTLMWFD